MLRTSPSTVLPTGVLLGELFPGVALHLLQAERDAALAAVHVEDEDVHFLAGGLTILPGWAFFLVQDISLTWTRPSTPGSSSTKAP